MTSNEDRTVAGGGEESRKTWDTDMHRQRRGKNLAFLAVLVGLIALFYLGYMARMGGL